MRYIIAMVPRTDLPVMEGVAYIDTRDGRAVDSEGETLFTLSQAGVCQASPPITDVSLCDEYPTRDGQTAIFPHGRGMSNTVWFRNGSPVELYTAAVVPVGHKVLIQEGTRAGQVWVNTINGWEPDPARRMGL